MFVVSHAANAKTSDADYIKIAPLNIASIGAAPERRWSQEAKLTAVWYLLADSSEQIASDVLPFLSGEARRHELI